MTIYRILFLATLITFGSYANSACTLGTVKGSFAASGKIDSFGFAQNGTDSNLIFLMGRFTFDGDGKVNLRNGKISIAGVYGNVSGGGRYNLNSNCIGSATITMNLKIPNQPHAIEQPPLKTKVKFDFVVSGTSNDPRIDMVYTDVMEPGESGGVELRKIRI